MNYDEKYFSTLNYTNYAERLPKYQATAREITELLEKLCLINAGSKIMDFGCGFGFLLNGLEWLNYENTSGYDISPYAREEARKRVCSSIIYDHEFPAVFKLMFALDVFEHMTDEEVRHTLANFSTRTLIFRIPVKYNINDDDFYLEVSRKDQTHINCKTKDQWKRLFLDAGFACVLPLNLYTIYDSPGVYCGMAILDSYDY